MTDNRTTDRVDHSPRVRDAIDELMHKKDATDSRTTELQGILDEFEHECFMLRVEASETRAKDDVVRKSYEHIRDEFARRIAATLGSDDDYERKMDALLCRLTNGKWSKSRAYSLDFMVSCVDEEYEDAYEKERAELGSGTCENISDPPEGFLCSECGWGDFAEPSHLLTTAKFTDNDGGPNHCPNCGRRVER